MPNWKNDFMLTKYNAQTMYSNNYIGAGLQNEYNKSKFNKSLDLLSTMTNILIQVYRDWKTLLETAYTERFFFQSNNWRSY